MERGFFDGLKKKKKKKKRERDTRHQLHKQFDEMENEIMDVYP